MLAYAFFSWWYGRGWAQVLSSFKPRLMGVANGFSVMQLSKTLFSPWRRIITYPGASIGEKFRAWGDNLFSRAIGFVVRLFVLIAAVFALAIVALSVAIEVVIWPLLPIAIPGLIVLGLTL